MIFHHACVIGTIGNSLKLERRVRNTNTCLLESATTKVFEIAMGPRNICFVWPQILLILLYMPLSRVTLHFSYQKEVFYSLLLESEQIRFL